MLALRIDFGRRIVVLAAVLGVPYVPDGRGPYRQLVGDLRDQSAGAAAVALSYTRL
jgi:hypothetical protein